MNIAPWITERIIYLTIHGSRAYGTSRPGSDVDHRGIAVPPARYLHGYLNHFESSQRHVDGIDEVIFDVRKFVKLAADCNPNALEILFVDPSDHLKVRPAAEALLAGRDIFLSKKARHTFSGYAMSQLGRIQSHRGWLLNPPKAPPTRAEFGLPERTVVPADQLAAAESLIRKQVESWDVDLDPLDDAAKIAVRDRIAAALASVSMASVEDQSRAAGRVLGFSDNFLELLDRERHYAAAMRRWTQYRQWVENRNLDRAALEAQYGYDTKHAMHLVRLMRMGSEILATGKVLVRRPDADELLAIRAGAWSYERLMEWAHLADDELTAAYVESKLPHHPDRTAIDALCVSVIENVLEFGV